MIRVAIVTTHPIQYQVPWLRGLAAQPDFDLHVLFGMVPDAEQQGVGFGVPFTWDVPLLDGYSWSVLENVAKTPSLSARDGVDTPAVGARLAELDPDVVVICGWQAKSLLQATRAARRLGIPRVIRGESNDLRPRPAWKRWLHRWHLGGFDAALAIGTANARFLRAAVLPAASIELAPYAVDTAHLARAIDDRAEVRSTGRERWELASDAFVALFVGKLEPKKRPLDLVEGVARARASGADVRLLVVGAGPLEAAVRERVATLAVPATFTGFLNQGELAEAYSAGDVFVLPSDHGETWGLVVNEAQAVGLPVVVSDQVGCGPDLVTPGETGWTYPCGDVESLAERLAGLARDPDLRTRVGTAGQRRVADFTIDRAVQATARRLRDVVSLRQAWKATS